MDTTEFLKEQFLTLRSEIKTTKARLFWIVLAGLFGVPVLSYLATDADALVWLLVPYFVLVLIVMFLNEQNTMMRAGQYIREQVEKNVGHSPGWEAWIESRSELRLMDRHFFACFIIIFFAYYFVSIGMAMQRFLGHAPGDQFGQYWYLPYGAAATYAIGGIWVISILIHHWRSSVSTAADED